MIRCRTSLLLFTCLCASTPAVAQIGSGNVAAIEPPVTHPDETPCSVPLFTDAKFGANAVPFSYAPPASCPGPWAKVVLSTDISLDAGRQFDRTASIWIGGVNMLFGTTAEPRASLAPSWHVDRDVTKDTALLNTAHPGHVLIANYQNSVYTSTITASSRLLFYPASKRYPAPAEPDLVIPLQGDPNGGVTDLQNSAQSLSRTLTLPANIEKVRLDVLLQSQSNDEFWYTCVPDALASALETCGGGSFREGEVAVDGVRAGVAPVYPWIYTGGIDPYLWQPIPGVQTLAFDPYTVDLTPFVGALDSGGTHTVSLSVAGANSYFSVTGTLYLTLDKNIRQVRGAVTRNTLAAPAPVTSNSITTANGTTTGSVLTSAQHHYDIEGFATTSHGVVRTKVAQDGRFSNKQTFNVTNLVDDQTVVQRTDTATTVTTQGTSGIDTETQSFSYPLTVHYKYATNADGSATQATAVQQVLAHDMLLTHNFQPVAAGRILERVSPTDTLEFTASGSVSSHSGSSSADYVSANSRAGCITRVNASIDSVLTKSSSSKACDPQALLP